jgi:hypothetical protein
MGYRIDFVEKGETLAAVVRGRNSFTHAFAIAQDIAEHAVRRASRRLLIDMRGLVGRVGSLSALLMAPATQLRCKVAVVDVPEYDAYYAFPEAAARARGGDLRYFASRDDALDWLGTTAAADSERRA